MILVIDDDEGGSHELRSVLENAGYSVHCACSADSALAFLSSNRPELILSGMHIRHVDGIELRKTVERHLPDRNPPYVFLSPVADPESIVRALDAGADDYLVQPLSNDLLLAKVRSLIRRHADRTQASFRGSLERTDMARLLKFCETRALTGHVLLTSPATTATIRFKGGVADLDDWKDVLTRIEDFGHGTFTIYTEDIDFKELESAAAFSSPGRISSIRVDSRRLQIQTELVKGSPPMIVSVVSTAGKALWKKRTPLEQDCSEPEIERMVDQQHEGVQENVEVKLRLALKQMKSAPDTKESQFSRLFDEGYERFRRKDYEGALSIWQEAQRLDPASKVLEVNIQITRGKMLA